MIVATKTVDSLLKGVISMDKLMISRIDSITKSIQLDPNISTPKKEMFIVSSDDVKNSKVRREFVDSVMSKHPENIIMYINKNGRDMPDINPSMFNVYLVKPKKEDIKDRFISLVEEMESKSRFQANDSINTPEDFKLSVDEVAATSSAREFVEEELVSLDIKEKVIEDQVNEEGTDNNLLDRIRRSENWAALNAVASEVSASRVVQEIANANASFRQSENYVSALSENITAILSNPEYNVSTQLSKIRSILHDRAYIKAKSNSIIEQSVEQIIREVVDKAKQEVEVKTQELDEKIIYAFQHKSKNDAANVRLSTIIEQRSKVLIELTALDLELKGLASICTDTVNGTVDNVLSGSVSTTESPILDSQIKMRYGEIVPENLLTVLDNLFQLGQNSCEEFGKMSQAVNSTVRKLYSLLSYYQEESEVLANTIRYLKANNVEDTVLANTIMKKTNRLFVNNGDFDSVALTYVISKHNSRKNNNVLLLDLSGTDVLNMFGINTIKYSDFMEREYMEGKFNVVSTFNDPGVSISTYEDCQRLFTRLLTYAKHYSMINIMCNAEQQVVLDSLKSDVISITYLVDCYPTSIKKMAKCIEETKVDNTASKVVLVNYLTDSSSICKELGVLDRLDMQLATCKPINEIRFCSINKQDPYDVESIVDDCRGVLKVC